MSKYYMTKETALRHIEGGENFRNKTFQKFWNDKEVFLAAAKKGFEAHRSNGVDLYRWGKTRDDEEKFPDWYGEWCWDADYVYEIAVVQSSLVSMGAYELDWLAAFLPNQFTGDPVLVEKLMPLLGYCGSDLTKQFTGEGRLKYQKLSAEKRLSPMEQFNRVVYERQTGLVELNPAVAAALVKAMESYLPATLLQDRDFCFKLVKEHGCWCGVILDHYREDRDFVTDLYEAGVGVDFNSLSYEIRKLVRKEDPRTFLSAYRLREQLENSVPATSTQTVAPKTKRLKI